MKPVEIEGANAHLGAPVNWDPKRDGECDALAVKRTHDAKGNNTIESAWMPSADELAALNRGAPVILTVWGAGHPPVSINVARYTE